MFNCVFKYDDYYVVRENGEIIGLCVKKDGKWGFICHDDVGIKCAYDFLRPFRNMSSFSNGKAPGSKYVYIIENNGLYGIESICQPDPFFSKHIPCKYLGISYIENFTACFVVEEKLNKDYFFLRRIDGSFFPLNYYPSYYDISVH